MKHWHNWPDEKPPLGPGGVAYVSIRWYNHPEEWSCVFYAGKFHRGDGIISCYGLQWRLLESPI